MKYLIEIKVDDAWVICDIYRDKQLAEKYLANYKQVQPHDEFRLTEEREQ